MANSKAASWQRFLKYYRAYPEIGLSIDISRMNFPDSFLAEMAPRFQMAFAEMKALEQGAIANADENRMVGHYWLRNPALAPTPQLRTEIQDTVSKIKRFSSAIHQGQLKGSRGQYDNMLLIGIGGSALGPQYVANALGHPSKDKLRPFFFDNTDPDGMDRTLARIPDLGRTLCLVISKSGGTKETRNGMLVAKAAYEKAGLNFGAHAVAVTGDGSELDRYAKENKWLERFPMWDWVGGRTSELSAVGLLPAALQGINIDELLEGARKCDEVTRRHDLTSNPAALLAAMWYWSGDGKGTKNMVVLPYKDRLELFSRYLQQLVMESLGKELDRAGKKVNQGLTVFGNKGSTDQHAYVQQLRDGLDDFFVLFIEVLKESEGKSLEVERGITSGDYLCGLLHGTQEALFEKGRNSINLTLSEVRERTIGGVIALFERAVGLYGSLVNVNAYHQPGVEAGKKAAASIIGFQQKAMELLNSNEGSLTCEQVAEKIGCDDPSVVWSILHRLAKNPGRGVAQASAEEVPPSERLFRKA